MAAAPRPNFGNWRAGRPPFTRRTRGLASLLDRARCVRIRWLEELRRRHCESEICGHSGEASPQRSLPELRGE
jgi:hypothetical protein